MIDLLTTVPIPQAAAATESTGQLPGARLGYWDSCATVAHGPDRALYP